MFSDASIERIVALLVRCVDLAGALIIFVGAVIAVARFVYCALVVRNPQTFVAIRLDLGRYLALGLEFQLASDLLRTAVAPSFEAIGKLAAIATIRTALNFFLAREIKDERAELARQREPLA